VLRIKDLLDHKQDYVCAQSLFAFHFLDCSSSHFSPHQ
jgi:hypothetical protein